MPDAVATAVTDHNAPPKVPVNRETLAQAARLFAYLLPYKGKFIAAMVALFAATGLGLMFPFLIGSLFNVALGPNQAASITAAMPGMGGATNSSPNWIETLFLVDGVSNVVINPGLLSSVLAAANVPAVHRSWADSLMHGFTLNGVLVVLVIQLCFQAAFGYLQVIWFNEVGEKALVHIRRDTYARLVALPMTFFAQRRVGELSSRISADLTQIEDTLTGATPQFLRQATLLLGSLAFIVFTSGRLTLVMLACFPPIILVAIFLGKRMRAVSRAAQDRLAESNTVVEETLQGIANVKAFANEGFEIGRYTAAIELFLTATLRGVRYRATLVAFIILALFGAIVVVMWYGCVQLQAGRLSVGDLTRFTIYTSFVAGAVGSFADLYGQIQKTVGATARVRELLLEEPEPVVPESAQTPIIFQGGKTTAAPIAAPLPTAVPVRFRGEVAFENVDFRYPSRPEVQVLRNLSLHALPGERVALVGPSGAGKSTLVTLLLRFYDPERGVVRLDGRSASDYPLREVRSQMAVVPQEVLLFGGSIAENIAYGKPGATQAEIEAAARQANAHDFIAKFPEGYGTVVGERGIKLSGGQRQRVAIARAILKDPVILILDEATSALDSESESVVQEALDVLMRGRTSFIIAHRLATVREADRIVVIQEGTVVESGTHADLLANKNGLYRRLSEFQFDLNQLGEIANV